METLELKNELNKMFNKELFEMYKEKVLNDKYYSFEEVEDFCSEYANATAESLTRDCISLINSKNWDVPKNNFYPFGFAMKSEYNITDKVQLRNRRDAAEIVSNWFWRCFGTYNLLYNFTTALTEFAETEFCNA